MSETLEFLRDTPLFGENPPASCSYLGVIISKDEIKVNSYTYCLT